MSHWALDIWVFWWLHTCQLLRIDIWDKEKANCILLPECLSMQLGGCGALWVPSLWFLQFFTCVSWGIFPAQILLIMQTTAVCHSTFYFSSFSMFIQSRIPKSVVMCSLFFPMFFSALYPFHPTHFYSSFYFLFCFLPLFIQFIFLSPLFSFQICYPFFSLFLLLCSVCFSLMLCSYSICSLSISLHPFRYLYLILLCYLFCSCFCFLYTSSFW